MVLNTNASTVGTVVIDIHKPIQLSQRHFDSLFSKIDAEKYFHFENGLV